MSLSVKRRDGETWEETIVRYAKPEGLETEVLEAYRAWIKAGEPEAFAVLFALEEWDLLDFVED